MKKRESEQYAYEVTVLKSLLSDRDRVNVYRFLGKQWTAKETEKYIVFEFEHYVFARMFAREFRNSLVAK